MGVVRLKLVIVGDGATGKTSMLMRFHDHKFSDEYVPTVFDNQKIELKEPISGQDVALTSWDTAGQEDYDRLRPLSYPDSDVVVIAFALNLKDSLANCATKWDPEVKQYAPGVARILVGMKADLPRVNSTAEGVAMARKLGCLAYCETSSKTGANVELAFMTAVRSALGHIKRFAGNVGGEDAAGCCALL